MTEIQNWMESDHPDDCPWRDSTDIRQYTMHVNTYHETIGSVMSDYLRTQILDLCVACMDFFLILASWYSSGLLTSSKSCLCWREVIGRPAGLNVHLAYVNIAIPW